MNLHLKVKGIRDHRSLLVRRASASFLRHVVTFHHPPTSHFLRNYYLKAFNKNPAAKKVNFDLFPRPSPLVTLVLDGRPLETPGAAGMGQVIKSEWKVVKQGPGSSEVEHSQGGQPIPAKTKHLANFCHDIWMNLSRCGPHFSIISGGAVRAGPDDHLGLFDWSAGQGRRRRPRQRRRRRSSVRSRRSPDRARFDLLSPRVRKLCFSFPWALVVDILSLEPRVANLWN